MTAQDYLQTKLQTCGKYALTDDDKKAIEEQGIEAYIYRKLTSKKFRKWAVDADSEQQAKHAISVNIAKGEPIAFRYPFGGYKLWRMPGYPEVDWAEFFAVAYYCQYLAPIAAAYEPGVALKFASDDVIIERMDNIPVKDTDAYFNSFKKLLSAFASHLPVNFSVDIVRIGDLYPDKNVMEEELAANMETVKAAYAAADKSRKAAMLTTSELNINFGGAKDLTKLSAAEKQAVINMGPIYHDAHCGLSRRREFNRGEDKIVLFTTPISKAIALGTTKSSVTKFWTGFGALAEKGDSFKDIILSPTQLKKSKLVPQPVIIKSLDGKNFKTISVLAD